MIVTGGIIPDGTGVALLARILGNGGRPITQADVGTITYAVTDLTNSVLLGSGSFAVAGSVYDALQQQDARWNFDSRDQPGADGLWGFNFLATLPATVLGVSPVTAAAVAGGVRVQCDVVFTPVVGQAFRVPFRWQRLPVFG